jgi:hypothetical protein
MKPLVVVFTQSKANDLVRRHYEYWKTGGCDLLGVLTEDGDCYWPGYRLVKIGSEAKPMGDHYIDRFLKTLRYCLNDSSTEDYRSFCFIEADSILTGPVPDLLLHL